MTTQQIIELYRPAIIQIATQTSTGTGFYVKEFDVIVTNEHVVSKTAEVTIAGRLFEKQLAKAWYMDKKHDLAFLQPPEEVQIPEVKLGDYDSLHDGEVVVAIGHPFGLNYTATQGVISKVDRVREGVKYIQIDAAINPGNSGGSLVNISGELIGINTAMIPWAQGICFSIPINTAKTIASRLITDGKISRAYLGIGGQVVEVAKPALRAHQLSGSRGVMVAGLEQQGPAMKVGMKEGDVIVEFSGQRIESIDDLHRLLTSDVIGKKVRLTVLRAEKKLSVLVSPLELERD